MLFGCFDSILAAINSDRHRARRPGWAADPDALLCALGQAGPKPQYLWFDRQVVPSAGVPDPCRKPVSQTAGPRSAMPCPPGCTREVWTSVPRYRYWPQLDPDECAIGAARVAGPLLPLSMRGNSARPSRSRPSARARARPVDSQSDVGQDANAYAQPLSGRASASAPVSAIDELDVASADRLEVRDDPTADQEVKREARGGRLEPGRVGLEVEHELDVGARHR